MSYQTIHAGACRHPDKTAVVFHDIDISYGQLVNAIDATIQGLAQYRLPENEPVGVLIPQLLDCWVVVLALQALGVPTVCARSTEVLRALGFAAITMVTTESEFAETAARPASRGRVISIQAPSLRGDISDLVPAFRSDAKTAGHIIYTSGTTGAYKKILWGGELQQRRNAERFDLSPPHDADTVYHAIDFGLWTAIGYRNPLMAWHLGGAVIFDQRPQWFKHFLRPSVTHAYLIPDKAHELLEYLRSENSASPLENLELSVAGGFMSRTLAEEILRRVTRKLLNVYGSTEVNIRVMEAMVSDLDDLHWLVPTIERTVEIVDEAGMPCAVDVPGKLRVRPTELDCSHYLDDVQATEKVFMQGYFHPGDMAVRRADGRIRILGRSADVINIRGQKLPVAPFEQQIQQRLGVDGVCLFSGIGDSGEECMAVALEAAHWPQKTLMNSIGQDFNQFAQVKFALFQRFPRTLTGTSKIDRISLRKLVFPGEGSAPNIDPAASSTFNSAIAAERDASGARLDD